MTEFSTSSPDDQFEFGLRTIQTAYKQKNDQLESSLVSLRQHLKDRELVIEDLKTRYALLENDTLEWRDKYARLVAEKETVQHENDDLVRIARDLRNEVDRLFAFKRAILETVDGESLNFQNPYPYTPASFVVSPLSTHSQAPSPSLVSARLNNLIIDRASGEPTETSSTPSHEKDRSPKSHSTFRRQPSTKTAVHSSKHDSDQSDIDTFLGFEKEDDLSLTNNNVRGRGNGDSFFTPITRDSTRSNTSASNQISISSNDSTSRPRSRTKDALLESQPPTITASISNPLSQPTKKEPEKRAEVPLSGNRKLIRVRPVQEERTPVATIPHQILERQQQPPRAPHKNQQAATHPHQPQFEQDQYIDEIQIHKSYFDSNTMNGKSLESMVFHVVPVDSNFTCEDCILSNESGGNHYNHTRRVIQE